MRTQVIFKTRKSRSAMSMSILADHMAGVPKAQTRAMDRRYIRSVRAENARIIASEMDNVFRSSLGL